MGTGSTLFKYSCMICNFSLATEPALQRGDSVYLVGLSRSLQATSRKSTVTNPCAALNISSAECPRYRATNMEVIELDTGLFVSSSFSLVWDNHQFQFVISMLFCILDWVI